MFGMGTFQFATRYSVEFYFSSSDPFFFYKIKYVLPGFLFVCFVFLIAVSDRYVSKMAELEKYLV